MGSLGLVIFIRMEDSYDDTWSFTTGDSQAVSRCPVPLAFCPGKQKLEQNF
jgi:hypothetical protein